jgi:hypothetical protein
MQNGDNLALDGENACPPRTNARRWGENRPSEDLLDGAYRHTVPLVRHLKYDNTAALSPRGWVGLAEGQDGCALTIDRS